MKWFLWNHLRGLRRAAEVIGSIRDHMGVEQRRDPPEGLLLDTLPGLIQAVQDFGEPNCVEDRGRGVTALSEMPDEPKEFPTKRWTLSRSRKASTWASSPELGLSSQAAWVILYLEIGLFYRTVALGGLPLRG